MKSPFLKRGLPVAALLSFLCPADEPGRVSIAVNKADLKDILRAATTGTHLNLIFEPGLETHAHGLDLKDMSLDEILDQVLPRLGLACTRQGRNLYIRKAAGNLRFYHVEYLSMTRNGTKSFQVNSSGQVLQSVGGGGGSANASAYTSGVKVGQDSDLWSDLENGLMVLIFGRALERSGSASQSPGSRGYSAEGKSLLIQPSPGLVAVDAGSEIHERVEAYLGEIRKRVERQVLLEARIVEVTLNDESQIGVDWTDLLSAGRPSGFTGGPPMSDSQGLLRIVTRRGRVEATLSAMARDNRLKVLSAPRLSVLNNQKAILRVVREEAFAVASSQITPGTAAGGAVATGQITPMIVPVGIILDIHPQIGDDGVITLAVNPSITELVGTKTFGLPGRDGGSDQTSTTLPVVDRRDLDTVVRIRSGDTLVLAGIIGTLETTENRGIPWLRKFPVLGNFFSRKKKTRMRRELAIFISPTLMEDPLQVAQERQGAEGRLEAEGMPSTPLPPGAIPGRKAP